MPQPPHVLEIPVRAMSADDAILLAAALARFRAADPTFRYRSDGPASFILMGSGEAQLDLLIERLRGEFALQLTVGRPDIAFRETITRAVEYDYTHKKQTGGVGEFARVKIRFEPLPRGSGFAFISAVIDGVVPREFVPGVERGLRAALDTGVHAGYPTIDFKASLIGGAYHEADSSTMTFEIASRACFREGMPRAGPQLLEPIMCVEVMTPNEYVGGVIADLNGRRGRIDVMDQRGTGCFITATVPFKELFGYANDLRALTEGRAMHAMRFDHYAPISPGSDPHPGAAIGLRIA